MWSDWSQLCKNRCLALMPLYPRPWQLEWFIDKKSIVKIGGEAVSKVVVAMLGSVSEVAEDDMDMEWSLT